MFKVTSTRSLVVSILMLITIGFAAQSFANHSWGPYHWARTSNPFMLKVGYNVSPTWVPHLDIAISDWSLSSVLNLAGVTGGTRPRNCRPTSGRIEVCNASYGNNGWLGIAQIWVTGGEHITQAITKVNDYYFNQPTYNTDAWRQFVMCQEIGHDFGLDHQDEKFDNPNLGSCMDYTNDPDGGAGGASNNDPSNEHPGPLGGQQHSDYDQLETIYAHLDSFTTVANSTLPSSMPPAMGQISFDTPAQWGQLIRSSANRRAQVYELDFGRGNKVITHVFWADPAGDAQ